MFESKRARVNDSHKSLEKYILLGDYQHTINLGLDHSSEVLI